MRHAKRNPINTIALENFILEAVNAFFSFTKAKCGFEINTMRGKMTSPRMPKSLFFYTRLNALLSINVSTIVIRIG